jgi:NTP pyrophosphatase (non-canonical NTP hydrolase)
MAKTKSQKLVAQFIAKEFKPTSVGAWLLDFESELGELAKEWLKGSDYGRGELELQEGWADEMGDVFFVMLALAEITDVDLEESLRKAIAKYEQRIESTGTAASGK